MLELENHIYPTNKRVVNTINILGQTVDNQPNTILFDVFNDGSVEKKYLLK